MFAHRFLVPLLAFFLLFAFAGDGMALQRRGDGNNDSKKTIPDEWMTNFSWRSIGPANMSGRITSIAVYEADPSIWYVATASGGLLKTTNNGVNFEHQFDDQATVSIGDVQVCQSNPDIVWVGTGEANPRNSVSWGNGVYKSTDGGKSWKHMGLDESFQIGRIAIHPEDPDVVFVGALGRLWGPNEQRGLFKTADGGKTWEKILFVDDKTGVIDVKLHPQDPDTLLVATYERERDGFDGNDPGKKYGEGSGLHRSTDGGKSFERVTDGMPGCKLGRIGLDWYRKDPNIVYAIVESEKIATIPDNAGYAGLSGENADVGARITDVTNNGPAAKADLKVGDIVVQVNGEFVNSYNEFLTTMRRQNAGDEVDLLVFRDREENKVTIKLGSRKDQRSGNGRRGGRGRGGNEFTGTLGGQAANLQGQQGGENEEEYGGVYMSTDAGSSWKRINTLNPRPMYYSQIRVDPSNNDYLYVLGTSLYRSTDGGETFQGNGGRGIHPDNHAMWIDPDQGKHIVLGNDGGVYVTWDRMNNWDHHNHIAIGQFYHVGIDHNRNYKVYGGLQDNGSWGGPANSRNGGAVNTDWFNVGGGDGFITLVDPTDADQIYFESQNGSMGRNNLRTGERGFIRPRAPRGTRYRFNWKTPFVLSPHNPKIHYSAGNHVFRSFWKGDAVAAISPDITNTDRGAGSAISESPVTAGVIYVGTTDGAVWMTRDGGQEWEEIFVQREEKEEESGDQEADASASASDRPEQGRRRSERSGRGSREGRAPATEASDAEPKTDAAKDESASVKTSSEAGQQLVGNWKGKMNFDQLAEDQRGVEMVITRSEDGKLGGEFTTPRSVSTLSDFEFDPKTGALTFSGANENLEVRFECEVSESESGDTVIKGKIDMGRFKIDFETKKSDDKNALASSVPLARNLQMVAWRVPGNQEVKDEITGTWAAMMESEEIPDGQGEFELELKLDDEGNVTGVAISPMGELEIYEGRYNATSKKLKIQLSSEEAGIDAEIAATVKGDSMSGSVTAGDGGFEADFSAQREVTAESQDEKAESKPDAETESASQETARQDEGRRRVALQEEAGRGRGRRQRGESGRARSGQDRPERQRRGRPQEESSPAVTATDEDSVTGKWEGRINSESGFMQGDRAKVVMTLQRGDDGKIKGLVDALEDEYEITEGAFKAEDNSVSISVDTGRFELGFTAKINDGKMSGEVDFDGRRSFEFELTRVSKTADVTGAESSQVDESAGARLGDLVPGPRWVSSIEASKHKASRVYLTLDGHRSNDDEPYLFVSENYGKTWSSIRGNLPTSAGSTRVLREDIENENLLFLGCEFSAWASIDRGKSWTRFQGNLPTVAIHEIAIHPTAGEIVAATHGRSLWIADITGLRKLSTEVLEQPGALLKPNSVVQWRRGSRRGESGTRKFVGQNASRNAEIFYYIGERIQNASISIYDIQGNLVRSLDAPSETGLHKVDWNLSRESSNAGGGRQRFRGSRSVPTGKYLVVLSAGGQEYKEILEVQADPEVSASATTEEEWEFMKILQGIEDDSSSDDQ